jgi:sec-independent protein translocase protein TatA
MPNLKGWEWLIIVALILLLFGAKRLPDAARGLGRSLRIFKAETKGLAEKPTDGSETATDTAASAPTTSLPAAPPPAPEAAAQEPIPTERREA